MEEQEKGMPAKFLGVQLSEAVLIAGATLGAYVLAFVYQTGYCGAFGIPPQLMALNVVDLLSIGSKILSAFFFIFLFINMLSSLLPRSMPSSLERRMLQVVTLLLLVLPAILFYEWEIATLILSIFIVLIVLAMFLPPIFARRYKGSYLQKMEALDVRKDPGNPWEGSLLNRAVNAVGVNIFMAVIYLFLAANWAYNAGRASALSQKIFFLASTSPDVAVLFMTSDRLISAPVDRVAKRIEPVFTIINLTNESTLTLRPVEIGPLKLQRSDDAQPKASNGRPGSRPGAHAEATALAAVGTERSGGL